jgi:predicted double-glycine peptidase
MHIYLLLLSVFLSHCFADTVLKTPSAIGTIQMKSWKELRDERVSKQELDYSCGPASVATILTHYYKKPVTEDDLIRNLNQWRAASFADLSRILPDYGYKGIGLALDAQQLRTIKIPAIVYLRHNGQDHFSVLKGVNEDRVYLADPSWGNVRFRWTKFLSMWETREGEKQKGKILLIVPMDTPLAQADISKEFFSQQNINYFDTEILTYRQPHRNF